MSIVYREIHVPDEGFRLLKNDLSIMIRSSAVSDRLTEEEMIVFANAFSDFYADIKGYKILRIGDGTVTRPQDFIRPNDGDIIKYVSRETYDLIREGTIQLGSCEYYRNADGLSIHDPREGDYTFFIAHGMKQFQASIRAGGNCFLLCGTEMCTGERDEYMRERHGRVKIRINNVDNFAEMICRKIGAVSYKFYNVIYSDSKAFVIEDQICDRIRATIGLEDISDRKLHHFNKRFFDFFYKMGMLGSMFIKPEIYRGELERRLVFEFSKDINIEKIIVKDDEINDYVEMI